MAPATTAWEQLTHGFQVSAMLQAYSALPFNITSGVTTVQGTAGRPIVDGEFIPTQRRGGDGVLHRSAPACRGRSPLASRRGSRGSSRCST